MRSQCAVLIVAGLVACQGSESPVVTPGPQPVVVVGDYALQAVKDQPLPWTLAEGPTSKTEYTGGNIVLRADKTYSRVTHIRYTIASVMESVATEAGTYAQTDEGAVTLSPGTGGTVNGQVTGKIFVASWAGCCEPFRYVRP